MDEKEARTLLDRLARGEIKECRVKKEDFMVFRKCLLEREDFKHFHGIAQVGGDVIYHYLDKPRS